MQAVAALCRELNTDRRADGELLGAFLSGPSEEAFVELIRRHGPLVWGACRRLLPDAADAEDAFQAAFLVLVRRAHRLTSVAELAPWLHRVAVWTARNVRRKNARRLARQTIMPEAVPEPRAPDADLKADLDAALLALPSRYRDSIILCHLQGFTRREAAERLGCPEGTLSAWLSRGLEKLRHRLRGLDPAKALAVPALAVPAALAANTASAAVASGVAAASVPPAVHSLVEGVLHMFWVKKATAASFALFAVFSLGVGVGVGVGTRTEFSGATAGEGPPVVVPAPPGAGEADLKLKAELARLKKELAEMEAKLAVRKAQAQLVGKELQRAANLGDKEATAEARAKLAALEAECAKTEEECQRLRERIKAAEAKLAPPAAPAGRDFTKEIAAVEEVIRATETAKRFALEAALQAKKRLEALNAANAGPAEIIDAQVSLGRFEQNVASAEAKLRKAKEQLAALKDAKAKADEKPAKPQPKAEPPKMIPVLNDLFGKPAELEGKLKVTQILAEQRRLRAVVMAVELAAVEKQGKPDEVRALKARVEEANADADVAQQKVEQLRHQLAAAKAVQAPPLKALGACIEVVVIGGGEPSICRVREYGREGKFLGAVIAEDAAALELVMSRALRDSAGPRDLWLTVSPEQSPTAILQAAEACKKAGFTRISINGTLPNGVKVPLAEK